MDDEMENATLKNRIEKGWRSFWELVSGLIGLAFIIGITVWAGGAVVDAVKSWFKTDNVASLSPVASYSPPKPSRPVGLVNIATTGEDTKPTVWYLRAETVLGPRTKRLFWVNLDYSKNKSAKFARMEMFVAVNCETMEMRVLSHASYKAKNPNAFFPENYAFDKAKVEYPVPDTGMMASYKEVCKDVYDIKA